MSMLGKERGPTMGRETEGRGWIESSKCVCVCVMQYTKTKLVRMVRLVCQVL